ncbi:MAG: hypothetical protein JKX68_13975 [Flavobacteriales bacterium]|nr:hypothetical protein [Flavobacteriales bacterium]
MLNFFKILIPFSFLFLSLSTTSRAQKIDLKDYENQAKAYAIMSAQYSKDAYYYSKKNYFSTSLKEIKQNCDTGLVCAQIAIEYADSAIILAYDTCKYAKTIMLSAKEYQQLGIISFKLMKKDNNLNQIHELSRGVVYDMGNAIADAYRASMFLDGEKVTTKSIKESKREITRLESDEFSYMTIKELYGKRLAEIDSEIILLEAEAKKSKGEKLAEINNAITQLRTEEKECFQKMKNSEDRLISVKNDLSEEMLKIVNKDIFTTEKEGFYNENIPVPSDVEVPKGLVYKVQIGFFKSQLPPEHFQGIFPLSSQKVDDVYYRYVAGNFAKYEDVKAAKIAISEKGYSDSFIVAYIDGNKVSISEALEKEKVNN